MSLGILVSFHYWRDVHLADALDGWRPLVFADSGAFSAANAAADISLVEYSAWLDLNRDWIDIACTLDVIGDHEQTYRNTRELEARGHAVIPVFHVGSPWDALRRLCARYPFVALGGMVKHKASQPALLRWLVDALHIATEVGTVCHGFGITSMNSVARLPLFSIDSTTWKNSVKYGELPLWDDMRGVVRIRPDRRRLESELLASYGFGPEVLARGYALKAGKEQEPFDIEYASMERAGLESWSRFERWWHARFEPINHPTLPPGPHVFVVCGRPNIALAKEVAQCQTQR